MSYPLRRTGEKLLEDLIILYCIIIGWKVCGTEGSIPVHLSHLDSQYCIIIIGWKVCGTEGSIPVHLSHLDSQYPALMSGNPRQ